MNLNRLRFKFWPLVFALLACLSAPLLLSQDTKLTPKQEQEVISQADTILQQLRTLRHAPPTKEIREEFKSQEQLKDLLIKYSHEEKNQQALEAERKTMIEFGLIPKDFPYYDFSLKLLTEQIAGFYDYHTHELNLLDTTPEDLQIPVLAHELTHALQDQQINLKSFTDPAPNNDDLSEAHQSLIEGDATAMMVDYLMRPMGRSLKMLGFDVRDIIKQENQLPAVRMQTYQEAPRAIKTMLMAPYVYGTGFIQYFLRDNDWPQISALYLDPPQSMEQVMHPQKYFDHREPPVIVHVPSLTGDLAKEWKIVDTNSLGELGTLIVLQQHLNDDNSRLASEGWGGDQYKICEDKAGSLLLLLFTDWDTEEDAIQFFNAYRVLLDKKYKHLQLVSAEERKMFKWNSEGKQIGLEIRGDDVVVIEGAPPAEFEVLRNLLWQSQKEESKSLKVKITVPQP